MKRTGLLVLAVLATQACTGAGGCTGFPGAESGKSAPASGHVPDKYVQDNVVQARVSPEGFAFLEQRKRHVSPPDQKPPTMAMPKAASGSCTGGGTDSSTCQAPTFGRFEHLAIRTLGSLKVRGNIKDT